MKKLLIGILMVLFALTGCSDSGGGGSKNPCRGPVPCLAIDWGNQYAVFLDAWDNPVVLLSDGEIMGFSAPCQIGGETCLCAFVGPVIDCYDADIDNGGFDDDGDYIIDYEFTSASGHVNVCATTLRIYNLVVEGEPWKDYLSTFDSMASLSASNQLSTDAPISAENVEKVKIMIKLLEQLMEE